MQARTTPEGNLELGPSTIYARCIIVNLMGACLVPRLASAVADLMHNSVKNVKQFSYEEAMRE
eukprot:5198736-Pyramimonas_sp.AAC.1